MFIVHIVNTRPSVNTLIGLFFYLNINRKYVKNFKEYEKENFIIMQIL